MWMISAIISKILSVLFPPQCYLCHKEETPLCSSCLGYCKRALSSPALYNTSIYDFQDPSIKKIIHAIKYFNRRDLIEPLTEKLAKEIRMTIGNKPSSNSWILIPIPMPTFRKYMRGYNQAELIARSLEKQCQLAVSTDILARSHSLRRQVTARTRNERMKNQHNSFKVIKTVKNMNIILVDDVTTTGATLQEARNVLLRSGAKDVKAVTIAH